MSDTTKRDIEFHLVSSKKLVPNTESFEFKLTSEEANYIFETLDDWETSSPVFCKSRKELDGLDLFYSALADLEQDDTDFYKMDRDGLFELIVLLSEYVSIQTHNQARMFRKHLLTVSPVSKVPQPERVAEYELILRLLLCLVNLSQQQGMICLRLS